MSEQDKDTALVQKALDVLVEHFDTAQIFVTRHEPEVGGTIGVNRGFGNWYARNGQVREWIVKDNEQNRVDVRKDNEDQE